MDYSWIIHRCLWISHRISEKLSVFFCGGLRRLSTGKRPHFLEIKQQELTNHKHEKDAHRKMTAIRLINSSSTPVSNPNVKKHMMGTSMDICG